MSEAGVGSFVADIVASVAFFLLPDSIADEAQVVFLVLLVVGFIALRVRGRRRRRSEEAAGGAARDRVASGHDPLAGWVPPGVGDTRGAGIPSRARRRPTPLTPEWPATPSARSHRVRPCSTTENAVDRRTTRAQALFSTVSCPVSVSSPPAAGEASFAMPPRERVLSHRPVESGR